MTTDRILVIGGGIAGLSAALDLADSGLKVYVVEKEPSVGGHALEYGCKATHQCTKCGVCLATNQMAALKAHPQIRIWADAEVTAVAGEAGAFQATVVRHPRWVDVDKCTACGVCAEACPEDSIGLPFPEAWPRAYAFDRQHCVRFSGATCTLCRDSCPFGAIDYDQTPVEEQLEIGAVVLAHGFVPFDARQKGQFGYGRYPNVLTGLDVERQMKSDHQFLKRHGEARDIAFIQCVGSRDEQIGHSYCSKVCCKYALRIADVMRMQLPDARVTIFCMDIQTTGKDFAKLYVRSQQAPRMRWMYSIPSEITAAMTEGQETGKLWVQYEDTSQGRVVKDEYDLVVLSVGITPPDEVGTWANRLGIGVNADGFYESLEALNTTRTTVEGIFLAGACQGPKNIEESIAHGKAAAAEATASLGGAL